MANVQLGSMVAAVTGVSPARVAAPAPPAPEAPRPELRAGDSTAAPSPVTSAPLPAAVQTAPQDAGGEALQAAISRIREFLNTSTTALDFTVDQASGRTVIRVVDTETKQLIRQIPSEEALAIARALDRVKGVLLQQQA